MSNYLSEIVERKKLEVEMLPQPTTFKSTLRQKKLAVIAEVKRKSPSKGILNDILDPVLLAKEYVEGGAAAISVLTDAVGFGGSLEDLQKIVEACPGIPVLRKDFIVDIKQLYETARGGAHAVLLIANILQDRLTHFIQVAKQLGLETLVEVHDVDELRLAHASGAEIIGVNNRNLTTFEVSLETSMSLAPHFSPEILKVSESGIGNKEHALMMRQSGYDAILVGEALVKAKDPKQLIREFAIC